MNDDPILAVIAEHRRIVKAIRAASQRLGDNDPHSPDDALICATITPIQIKA